MKSLIAIISTLVFSLAFIFAYPNWAIKPGVLSNAHQRLNKDCLACHTPLQGATAEKCIFCHKPADIGRITTTGVALARAGKSLFHQSLANSDCTGCHTLHTSARGKRATEKFKHNFLKEAAKNNCASCHQMQKPADSLHQQVGAQCVVCHQTTGWRVVSFDHQRLAGQNSCVFCHQKNKPADPLHQQIGDDCAKCHSTTNWRGATFEHTAYFRFDGNHPSTCNTCHVNTKSFSEYTCYGCHEHTPANIAAEHLEEGIRNYENCVNCHRSGNADEAEHRREGEGRANQDANPAAGKTKRDRDDD
ncbi:MAG: cytochrome c3 family protein [Acidobacteriota bacterium]